VIIVVFVVVKVLYCGGYRSSSGIVEC